MNFLSYLINGISLGSVYAIIALGYTMVYGIAKMLNFAHGDVIMIGCYVVFLAMSGQGISPLPAVVLSIIVCTVLGIVVEKIAYKPLRRATPLAVLITAIGVSYFLQNAALLLFGADTKSFSSVVSLPSLKLADGALTISGTTIVTVLACVVIMIALMMFIKKTKAGQAMLAVSEDKDAAQLMGVNVNATISLTFAIGSGLAAIAGVLFCSAYPTLTPSTQVSITSIISFFIRGSTTCASGSPNLALYSNTLGPFGVSISPKKMTPLKGLPSAAMASTVAW